VAVEEAMILLLTVYLRQWGSADFCVPFSLVRTHDSHRGTRLDCRGNVEELPTETVAASHEWFFQDWVWHCYGGER